MKQSPRSLQRILALATLLAGATLSACEEDPTRPQGAEPREYAVVLNSTGLTLTVFPVDAPDSTRTIALGPDGTPGSIAVRGDIALVPLGVFPAVAVVDLDAGAVLRTIPLPAGSGATGAAIANDSIGFVANPQLGSVSPLRYRSGAAGTPIPVGVYPQALLATGDRVFVIEANLVNFMPAGPSSVSVIDAGELEVDASFPLGGTNAGHAVLDGATLYVLNSGTGTSPDASLSVIELPAAAEATRHEGFGTFPVRLARLEPGRLAVASPVDGVSLFDAVSGTFELAPENGFLPPGAVNVLAVGADSSGRLYVADAKDCTAPGVVFRVTDALAVETTTNVGSCPIDIVFTTF